MTFYSNIDSFITYHFAIDNILWLGAYSLRSLLVFEDDETKAPGLMCLAVEHHLGGDHPAKALEVGPELG